MPGLLIKIALKYKWVFRWLGTAGFLFGLLLLVMGLGVYSGVVEGGNVTKDGIVYELASIRGLGALIFFPLFVLAFFGWIRNLPVEAKKDWLLKNLPKEEKDKLEVKFELEEK